MPAVHPAVTSLPAQRQQSKWGDHSGRSTCAGFCPARSVWRQGVCCVHATRGVLRSMRWAMRCVRCTQRRQRTRAQAAQAAQAARAVCAQRTCSASPTYTARGAASPTGVTQTAMWPGVWPGVGTKLSCGARAGSIAPPSPSNSWSIPAACSVTLAACVCAVSLGCRETGRAPARCARQ